VRAGRRPRPAAHVLRGQPETGLFEPEYVNIFGVPFTFLPHEGARTARRRRRRRRRRRADPAKEEFEIRWPNVVRIDHVFQPVLTLDWAKVRRWNWTRPDAQVAELAPVLEGKPDVTKINRIELEQLAREFPHPAHHLRDRAGRVRPDEATGRAAASACWRSWCGSSSSSSAPTGSIFPPLFYQDDCAGG
jgi:hypothetical protein